MLNENANLAEELRKVLKELPEGSTMTWDDFFDKMEVPEELRTDYAVGCILRQYAMKGG